jgi:hypothetical protein
MTTHDRFLYLGRHAPDEIAEILSKTLTDLEFELLVRKRINRLFAREIDHNSNLSESHHRCRFEHSFEDKGTWNVRIGENYSKNVSTEGEVLTHTILDARTMMDRRNLNSMSSLQITHERSEQEAEQLKLPE